MFIFSIQIWNYVKLSECQIPWNNSNDSDSTPHYMHHDDVQLTICEKGPFPSVNVPPGPGCNSK